MLESYDIKKLLHIQDESITLTQIDRQTLKGVLTNIVRGTITYTPNYCPKCGVKNVDYTIIKHGTKLTKLVWNKVAGYPTRLYLKKQRFFCKSCMQTFSAHSSEVEEHCFISKKVKQHIGFQSREDLSMKYIAEEHTVSPSTVKRVICTLAQAYYSDFQSLPSCLLFDEFKSVKNVKGSMSFIYADGDTHEVIDVLPDRRKTYLKLHFQKYSLKVREQVKLVVIDMNAAYEFFIRELFPNAQIIIDRFHIIQLINRSLNRIRVKVMKQYNRSSYPSKGIYNKFKNHWRLLLKEERTLSSTDYKYYTCFGQTTQQHVVDTLLSFSSELGESYRLYQDLLHALKTKNYSQFQNTLKQTTFDYHNTMRISQRTLHYHLKEGHIETAFLYRYSNGPLEGSNNKVKNIKRTAYGFISFNSFRNRLVLSLKMKPKKRRSIE
ncbi:ISL3 family transposase [Marinilactibacillus sp. GCM10026970]|uniref:ISL3 family transposase n=1 Tax=Marinilactibacillus sp. GCM10026970 TaxID=3252642 RepID=UPI0036174EE0